MLGASGGRRDSLLMDVQIGRVQTSLYQGGWYHDAGSDTLYVQVQAGIPEPPCCQVDVGAGTVVHCVGPDQAAVYAVEVFGTAGWAPPACLPPDVAALVVSTVARLAR